MSNKNKGVREYQLLITYFLILDKLRGATYGELARKYKLDKSNIRKRVCGITNASYHKTKRKQATISDQAAICDPETGRFLARNTSQVAE